MEQRKPRVDKENYIKNWDAFNWWWVVRKYSNPEWLYFPKNILDISNADQRWKLHPTQKPVALIEYLIKTYTNEWETVLDFTAWSFTTAVACENTNRKWICIEKDLDYCRIWKERIIKNRIEKWLDILDFTAKIPIETISLSKKNRNILI